MVGGGREERLLIFKQRDRRRERGGVEREGEGEREREKREKEMLWDLFFSLAPGTYIKMLILVFFVSFYNSLHFVPLPAPVLRLSLSRTSFSHSLSIFFPSALSQASSPPRLEAPGERIPTLIFWYCR